MVVMGRGEGRRASVLQRCAMQCSAAQRRQRCARIAIAERSAVEQLPHCLRQISTIFRIHMMFEGSQISPESMGKR